MKQISFAQAEHQNKKKVTRRERFLAQMDILVPWQRLIEALSPSYFPNSAGKRGRPPIGLERMLRVYFLQQWYALSDKALEDAIYDSQAMRDFIGIDLVIVSVPDATMLLRFPPGEKAWPDPANLQEGHRQPGRAGPVHTRGHHRGGRSLHQEQGQAAQSGDGADQERQLVFPRTEGPYRRRCRDRTDPQCRYHPGKVAAVTMT